jgi:formylglycine-generating enzyme required for sulfatase activity
MDDTPVEMVSCVDATAYCEQLTQLEQDVITYSGGSVIDPQPAAGEARMSRGGSWHSLAPRCRSASRNPYDLTGREAWVGFRMVLAPEPP